MAIRHNLLKYLCATLHMLLTFFAQQNNKHFDIDKF
jgi:hypothetical protein